MERAKSKIPYDKKYDFGPIGTKRLQGNYRLIIVEAEKRAVERLNWKVVPAHFSVKALDGTDPERYNFDHVKQSISELCELVNKEAKDHHGGKFDKIHLAGMSQGACLAISMSILSTLKDPEIREEFKFGL